MVCFKIIQGKIQTGTHFFLWNIGMCKKNLRPIQLTNIGVLNTRDIEKEAQFQRMVESVLLT